MTGSRQGLPAARATLFELWARLVETGLDPALYEVLSILPETADLVGPPKSAAEAAADHYDLFGFRVPPFAGLFLDTPARTGGRATDGVANAYREAGFDPVGHGPTPDHLAVELRFLAWCAERGRPTDAARFLDAHLLGWAPSLVSAAARGPYPAYRLLLGLLLEAVFEYRGSLPAQGASAPEEGPEEHLLDRPDTGVRDIAEFLATPARAGLFVGRGDVMRLGREIGAPRGFGGRADMLLALIRSAAEFDAVDALAKGLDALAEQTRAEWSDVPEVGSLRGWSSVWTRKIERTRTMLHAMSRRLVQPPDDGGGSSTG